MAIGTASFLKRVAPDRAKHASHKAKMTRLIG